MGISVNIEENDSVRVTDQLIDTEPPDSVTFAAEGMLTMAESLLEKFEGASLKPVEIEMTVDELGSVEIDLEDAELRLETVDIGIETPNTDDLSLGVNSIPSASGDTDPGDDESGDPGPGAIAFTVEGVIRDVARETLEELADGSPELASVTFAVEEPIRSDGGSGNAVFEFDLLGFEIAVYRDGTIEIGARGATDVGLP